MKLQLFQSKEQTEDRIDIYYTEMNPVIRKVIDVVHTTYPVLKSKEEDEIRYLNIDRILWIVWIRRCLRILGIESIH